MHFYSRGVLDLSVATFSYRKFPKYSDTPKICYHSKILTMWLYHRVMSPNDTDGMTNNVDPDQTEQSDLGLHCLPRHICPKTVRYSKPTH